MKDSRKINEAVKENRSEGDWRTRGRTPIPDNRGGGRPRPRPVGGVKEWQSPTKGTAASNREK